MRKTLLIATVLLSSMGSLFCQTEPKDQIRQTPLGDFARKHADESMRTIKAAEPFTRLAYKDTSLVDHGAPGTPQVCLAFRPDGSYRLWRATTTGRAQTLAGTLTQEGVRELKDLIAKANLARSGRAVRGMMKSLLIETPEKRDVERRSWVGDRGNPLPDSVAKVVEWLQGFNAYGAKPKELGKHDVCPAPRVWPVPALTANR